MKIQNGKIVTDDPSDLRDAMEVARFQRWLGEKAKGRAFRGETAQYLGMTDQEHVKACALEESKENNQ